MLLCHIAADALHTAPILFSTMSAATSVPKAD